MAVYGCTGLCMAAQGAENDTCLQTYGRRTYGRWDKTAPAGRNGEVDLLGGGKGMLRSAREKSQAEQKPTAVGLALNPLV